MKICKNITMTRKNKPPYNKFNYIEEIVPDVYFIEFNVQDKVVKNRLILYLKNYKHFDLKTAKHFIESAANQIFCFGYSSFDAWKQDIDMLSEIMPPEVSWRIYCNEFLRGEKDDDKVLARASN